MVEHHTHPRHPRRRMPLDTLKEGRIIGTSLSEVGDLEAVPVLLVQKGGRLYHVELWRDAEGNGPGYAYIEEAGKLRDVAKPA